MTRALVPTGGAPTGGALQRLAARVGSGHAKRTLLTRELRSAERSHHIGLTDVLLGERDAALAPTSSCPQTRSSTDVGRLALTAVL